MSRDGSGVYTKPFPSVVADTTIASTMFNGTIDDLAQDANVARPVVAGGTGANNVDTALFNLKGAKAAQVVTNYDTHLWIPGTFYSATTATGEPVDGHAFSGVVYIGEAITDPPTNQNVVVEARDETDGRLYIRRKVAGVWSAWQLDGDLSGVNAAIALKVAKAGDTMTGFLTLHAAPDADMKAANKKYVDDADAVLANSRVAKAGDTMTGFLTLHADPDAALKAATKQYVDNRPDVRYDAAQGLNTTQRAQARANISAALRGHLWGLTLSTAGSSTTFGVAAGEAADSTNVDLMVLASAYTKTTGSWTVGTGNGALDTGSISAAATYHVFLIKRPDTGVVDVLISASPTAPTLPANYTIFRRIGSMLTNGSSQWIKFFQNGDDFSYDVALQAMSGTAISSTATLFNMLVPNGISVEADLFVEFTAGGSTGVLLIYDPAQSTQVANTPGGNASVLASIASTYLGSPVRVRTNTSAQAYFVSSIAGNAFCVTKGWRDTRGRLA